MSIPQRGLYEVQIGGEELEVRYNMAKIAGFEEYMRTKRGEKTSAIKILQEMVEDAERNIVNIPVTMLADMLLFGLSHEQKRLAITTEKIFDWMDEDDFDLIQCSMSVFQAFAAAINKPSKGDEGKKPQKKAAKAKAKPKK